eukprot:c16231_g1_i1.p1 GENE.c16231_g1_i1~~c16231_g1_i1.p1  ORF type:complete len:344 (+),score=127.55 c16231_g1_i1:91-1122(+)
MELQDINNFRGSGNQEEENNHQQASSSISQNQVNGNGNGGHSFEEDFHLRETIVSMTNVHKTYLLGIEGVPALRGVDLNVKKGEFVAVYGTSGGGKTSLLNIAGTIDQPTKGGLQLFQTRIDRKTKENDLANIRMHKMGFVFQTFNLISSMTAIQNVELPLILSGKISSSEITKRATELLNRVGMGSRLYHYPSQLSGGEQQRVTIARALVNNPDLLLLDEPTGDLDTKNTDLVMKILLELNSEGITMIMVTHDDSLKNYAHRIVYMVDGRVKTIKHVTHEEREAQLDRLSHASRTLRTGIGRHDLSQSQIIDKCSYTTLRTPPQYVMKPFAVPPPSASNTLA